MAEAVKSETELFFEIASEFTEAKRNRVPRAAVDDLAGELMDMWQHTANATVRRRCEALLSDHDRIRFRSVAG